MKPVRVFEIHINDDVLHLVGNDQVAELIAILSLALRDSSVLDAKAPAKSWQMVYEYEPITMECRSKLVSLRELKQIKK